MSRYLHSLKIDDVCLERQEGFCFHCQKLLTGKQTKWCSKDCYFRVFEKMMFAKGSSKHLRNAVFARDNGICASCGVDCKKLQRISDAAFLGIYNDIDDRNPFPVGYEFVKGKGFFSARNEFEKQSLKDARKLWKDSPLNFGGSCWQADHILEVVHGGKHEMENLQTLCNYCHKNKTAKMNRPKKSK